MLLDLPEQLEAAHLGHADVGDRGVIQRGAQGIQGLPRVARGGHLVAPLGQGFPEEPQDRGLVVDDQNLRGFHGSRHCSMGPVSD